MKKKIDYINAHNGGIKMYAGVGNVKGWAKTATGIAILFALWVLLRMSMVAPLWTLPLKKVLRMIAMPWSYGMKLLRFITGK